MNIMLLIHPHYAAHRWQLKSERPELTSYFDTVLKAIDAFDGHVFASQSLTPDEQLHRPHFSKENYELHDQFVSDMEKRKVMIVGDLGMGWQLCHIPLENYKQGIIGGGYTQLCFRYSIEALKAKHGKRFTDLFQIDPKLCFHEPRERYSRNYLQTQFQPMKVLERNDSLGV